MSIFAALTSGFALQGALIVAIGAQNAFVLRQGLRREHVGTVVAFCTAADLILTAAGVAGVGATLGQAPGLTRALALGGAVFLAWSGIGALRRALKPGALAAAGDGDVSSRRAVLAKAVGFTVLNPHVYIDTVLLAGAVGSTMASPDRPAFVIGAGAASLLWFAGLGYGARLLAPVFARPAAWRWLDAGVAALMLTLAAGLAGHAAA